MVEEPYEAEAILQQLLADYPNLLGGDRDSSAGKRWLLVQREIRVPAAEDAGGRWSVDHLFLDEASVPTLVEVKRSTDTRIRREVGGDAPRRARPPDSGVCAVPRGHRGQELRNAHWHEAG